MFDILPIPLQWYLIGPLMGLTVAGFYATANRHLGISGSYAQISGWFRGKSPETWRLWFLGGTVVGAAIVAVLGESPQFGLDYGVLGREVSLPVLIGILLIGGILMGYGARMAGGCTSGHGITGCAIRSPASFAAIIVIMITAIAVALIIHGLSGGAV